MSKNAINGWIINLLGFWCLVYGNTECGVTCFCTALILFSIKE